MEWIGVDHDVDHDDQLVACLLFFTSGCFAFSHRVFFLLFFVFCSLLFLLLFVLKTKLNNSIGVLLAVQAMSNLAYTWYTVFCASTLF